MIEDLKQVREALAEYKVDWRTRAGTIDPLDLCLATLDRLIAEGDHIADVGKMVVPDGFKLVDTKNPITSEMKAAYIGEFSFTTEEPLINEDWEYTGEKYDRENVVPWDLCKKIYKSMLSAAPPAQPEKVDLEELKREINDMRGNWIRDDGSETSISDDLIDHLAATGRIKGV